MKQQKLAKTNASKRTVQHNSQLYIFQKMLSKIHRLYMIETQAKNNKQGTNMKKVKENSKDETDADNFSIDSDQLQLLDEWNSEWVSVWKATSKQTELEILVATPDIQEMQLVGAPSKKSVLM
jgi:hypothetical protein